MSVAFLRQREQFTTIAEWVQQQMLNNFTDMISRAVELKNGLTTKEFARRLGMTQQTVDLYLKGERKPSLEFVYNICSSFGVSADWLLGLDGGSGGQRATASGAGAIAVVGANATVSAGRPGTPPAVPADCSKCRLMQAHLREITGRG